MPSKYDPPQEWIEALGTYAPCKRWAELAGMSQEAVREFAERGAFFDGGKDIFIIAAIFYDIEKESIRKEILEKSDGWHPYGLRFKPHCEIVAS